MRWPLLKEAVDRAPEGGKPDIAPLPFPTVCTVRSSEPELVPTKQAPRNATTIDHTAACIIPLKNIEHILELPQASQRDIICVLQLDTPQDVPSTCVVVSHTTLCVWQRMWTFKAPL